MSRAVQSLPLAKLLPQRGRTFKGGVEDEGDFKEGYCFKLNFLMEGKKTFVICAEEKQIKSEWMDKVLAAKQKLNVMARGVVPPDSVEPKEEGTVSLPGGEGESAEPAEQQNQEAVAPGGKVDGHWMEMQEWSSCTVACGGGTQSLHRVCIPPQNGGKQCEGAAILERPCNEQACVVPGSDPDGSQDKSLPMGATGQETITTKEPVVQMRRISAQPQMYQRCIIKDTDIDVVQTQLAQFQVKPRLPGRLVMNNRTISVFMKKSLESAVFSVPLDRVVIRDYKDDEQCWRIQDSHSDKHVAVVCGMRSSKERLDDIKQEWLEQTKFFKNNCFQELDRAHLAALGASSGVQDPLIDLKQQELDELKKHLLKKEEPSLSHAGVDKEELQEQFTGLQNMAIEAMSKEMKYEQLLEQEEKQRQKEEKEELAMKLENLRNKDECLGNQAELEQKRQEEEEKKNAIGNQIAELKTQIKNMILKNRENKKKKLEQARRLNDQQKKSMLAAIAEERVKLAADVMKAHRKGEMETCMTKDQGRQCAYCEKHFKDDTTNLVDCKKENGFCFMCCINEFGDYHVQEKNKCLDACDCGHDNGNWVWVPKENEVK